MSNCKTAPLAAPSIAAPKKVSYLKKLISSDSFKFENAIAYANPDQQYSVEKIRELHPELTIHLKEVKVTNSIIVNRKDVAKVFFLVDVSGSVDRRMKEHFAAIQEGVLASLVEDYKVVKHGVILHHTQARNPVTGYDWVDDCETGGTIVSSAYEKVREQIHLKNGEHYDFYVVQLTDGDNWADDTPTTNKLVNEIAIQGVKGFKYFEVGARTTQTLYKVMKENDCVDVFRMKTGSLELLKDS